MDPEESNEAYLARHIRAVEEEARRPPVSPTGETFPVRVGGSTRPMDRAVVEDILRTAAPRGSSYLYTYVRSCTIDVCDFEAACASFGLRGALEDTTYDQIQDEIRARRERGDAPSTGMLRQFLDEVMPREMADARIAIVERHIAVARAAAPAAQAARPAARREESPRPARRRATSARNDLNGAALVPPA